jgi:hypothetical protein
MTELRLVLSAPDRVPLDEVLVVTARLANNGPASITTSSRLDLAEGDLDVVVRGPDGIARRAGWPWPVDSALRQVELAPGQVVEGAAMLLSAGGVQPLFPVAGSYTLVGQFTPSPGAVIDSEPIQVLREEPAEDAARARRRALEDPEVMQSLASASVLGKADMLADLAATGPPVARLLAQLARGDTGTVRETASDIVGQSDSTTVAAAVASVLPTGLYPGDERLEAVAAVVAARDDTGKAAALLTGQPYIPSSQ